MSGPREPPRTAPPLLWARMVSGCSSRVSPRPGLHWGLLRRGLTGRGTRRKETHHRFLTGLESPIIDTGRDLGGPQRPGARGRRASARPSLSSPRCKEREAPSAAWLPGAGEEAQPGLLACQSPSRTAGSAQDPSGECARPGLDPDLLVPPGIRSPGVLRVSLASGMTAVPEGGCTLESPRSVTLTYSPPRDPQGISWGGWGWGPGTQTGSSGRVRAQNRTGCLGWGVGLPLTCCMSCGRRGGWLAVSELELLRSGEHEVTGTHCDSGVTI